MMLIDAIRRARCGDAILFLLTAYLEARQFAGRLPAPVTALPLAGRPDVILRMEKLAAAMESSIRLLDLSAIDATAEAVGVFDAAINRLAELGSNEPAVKEACDGAALTPATLQKVMATAG